MVIFGVSGMMCQGLAEAQKYRLRVFFNKILGESRRFLCNFAVRNTNKTDGTTDDTI